MKEYKVKLAKNLEEAEKIMNDFAKDGWKVVSTVYWHDWKAGLTITFEREKAE